MGGTKGIWLAKNIFHIPWVLFRNKEEEN